MIVTRYAGLLTGILICSVVGSSLTALAASNADTFDVTFSIDDPDPPTIPGNVAATPVTSSQIDVTWDASSDNVAVSGYQISRDGTPIATTTLTTFSDTGLTPSTTYSYTLRAFDPSFNYSTATTPVATTTLQFVPTPTSTPTTTEDNSPTRSGLRNIWITDLHSTTTEHEIELSFRTSVYTEASFLWGRTTDYEGGYITSDVFRRLHGTVISGLMPGTTYEIAIQLSNRDGSKTLTETLTLTTKAGPDITAPQNVTNFRAEVLPSTVELTWDNPSDTDFDYVRILSSDYFYPTHLADGWLVYEGDEEAALDIRQLNQGAVRYYTIFAVDATGNVSSGVVLRALQPVTESGDGVGIDIEIAPISSPDTTLSDTPPTFTFADVRFEQAEQVMPVVDNAVQLRGDLGTTVSVSYDLLPEHLKTIVVTMTHPDKLQGEFSFLLRINQDRSAYSADIGPLITSGWYPTTVAVYDFKTQSLFTVSGDVYVAETKRSVPASLFHLLTRIGEWWLVWYILPLFLLGVCWYYFFWYRRSREEETQP